MVLANRVETRLDTGTDYTSVIPGGVWCPVLVQSE